MHTGYDRHAQQREKKEPHFPIEYRVSTHMRLLRTGGASALQLTGILGDNLNNTIRYFIKPVNNKQYSPAGFSSSILVMIVIISGRQIYPDLFLCYKSCAIVQGGNSRRVARPLSAVVLRARLLSSNRAPTMGWTADVHL
jgi:hypothetical protein